MLATNFRPPFLICLLYNWFAGLRVRSVTLHLGLSTICFLFLTKVWIVLFNLLLDLQDEEYVAVESHTCFADPTDIHLRHSMANLVACALGTCTCDRSSHLWYLIFAPEALQGTFLAGYMVDLVVNMMFIDGKYNYLVFFLPMYLYRMMVLSVSKKADHIRKEHRSQMMT